MKHALLITSLLLILLPLCAEPPVISNITMAQRTDGSKLVDIWYDLEDDDTPSCTVSLKYSSSSDNYYNKVPSLSCLSGDIGTGVSTGTGKHIVWDIGSESENLGGGSYRVKVSAEDGTVAPLPASLYLVAGGTFNPTILYTVTLSSYYIGRYEVTRGQHLQVMGPSAYSQGDPDLPVSNIPWLRAIQYCNWRSEREGLTPCYFYIDYGTDTDLWPYEWSNSSYLDYLICCDFGANGYRLPTEMEWMFAAKGGNASMGYTYSGSDDIDQVAWYLYNAGNVHPVGTKASNELALFDMSGNALEWVWDYWLQDYPTGEYTDPTGPGPVSFTHVKRGGCAWYGASHCTVEYRSHSQSTYYDHLGFRVVRNFLYTTKGE